MEGTEPGWRFLKQRHAVLCHARNEMDEEASRRLRREGGRSGCEEPPCPPLVVGRCVWHVRIHGGTRALGQAARGGPRPAAEDRRDGHQPSEQQRKSRVKNKKPKLLRRICPRVWHEQFSVA